MPPTSMKKHRSERSDINPVPNYVLMIEIEEYIRREAIHERNIIESLKPERLRVKKHESIQNDKPDRHV